MRECSGGGPRPALTSPALTTNGACKMGWAGMEEKYGTRHPLGGAMTGMDLTRPNPLGTLS